MDRDISTNELISASLELHEKLWLCFDNDRLLCESQEFDHIAKSLLGQDVSDCGMSNLESLAASVRQFEKAIIAMHYK